MHKVSNNDGRVNIHPLLWAEARSNVREALENYVRDTPLKRQHHELGGFVTNKEQSNLRLFSLRNVQLNTYAGSIFFSLLLFIMSLMFLMSKSNESTTLNPEASRWIYVSQFCAAILLLCGSVTSMWMVRRRRFVCLHGSDSAKRREISKFLKSISPDTNCIKYDAKSVDKNPSFLSGTSLTDIYPVYRKITTNSAAIWSRIPSLLLAQGDIIALQFGDHVPADCVSVDTIDASGNYLHFKKGERLSLISKNQNVDSVVESLPKGRTTLTKNSECFLALCNNIQLFRVVESPIVEFLRRDAVATRPSQLSRKLKDVDRFLYMICVPVVILTFIAVFSRLKGTSVDMTFLSTLPMLAALGVLPVAGPCCVIVVEVIGTARILTTVHPFACSPDDLGSVGAHNKHKNENLLFRYIIAAFLSRLGLWELFDTLYRMYEALKLCEDKTSTRSKLIRIPPASLNVLDVLGLATALALVDDELACEPHSIPQQLLIPSGQGLKLLDLCPEHDDKIVNNSFVESVNTRTRGKSFDSDLDSDDSKERLNGSVLRRNILRRNRDHKKRQLESSSGSENFEFGRFDVQFEEPNWWQHLPSLKCIGLACLLNDGKPSSETLIDTTTVKKNLSDINNDATSSLVQLLCNQRSSHQFRSLAECIGFSTDPNSSGDRGDISPFTEVLRINMLSASLFKERLLMDAHERSSEQSRWWGLIRPDSTSVVVRDDRTQAYQLLTSGDPLVILNFCHEAWQGEISTILPLAALDKQTIIETTNNWKLGDLDVTAFCYAPVPHNVQNSLLHQDNRQIYLLDNSGQNPPLLKDKSVSQEWSIVRNQIFLGVLGSLVVPRREIQKLLDILSDAGIRFVYFSPRNMRRQKELAIQMGIDVAWNCAISLRPLESGEEDPHRMVSAYADWYDKAKLPHGVDDVRKHLKEVDNVPLLVSLFTDVTKETSQEMVEIFQEYNDTVITIGLSHLPTNDRIFATSDIAVGIDVLTTTMYEAESSANDILHSHYTKTVAGVLLPSELEFVSSLAAHSCAFRFRGAKSISNISTIVEKSRVSLESAIAAGTFFVTGSISFSLYVVFSSFMPTSTITYTPMLGAVVYLQIILPLISLAIAFSDGDKEIMKRVPPKNDINLVFGKREGYVLYLGMIVKGLLPAILPQILHPMVYGNRLLQFEPDLVSTVCPGSKTWIDVIHCDAIHRYNGNERMEAGCWIFVLFVLCVIGASSGFVHLYFQVWDIAPWKSNTMWVISSMVSLMVLFLFAILFSGGKSFSALPWYYYPLALFFFPFASAVCVEVWKRSEIRLENRAEKIRRLQFETRLGAWSPR